MPKETGTMLEEPMFSEEEHNPELQKKLLIEELKAKDLGPEVALNRIKFIMEEGRLDEVLGDQLEEVKKSIVEMRNADLEKGVMSEATSELEKILDLPKPDEEAVKKAANINLEHGSPEALEDAKKIAEAYGLDIKDFEKK